MKSIKSMTMVFLIFCMGKNAALAATGNSGWKKIVKITSYSAGTAVVYTEENFSQINCENTASYRIDDASGPAGSHLYSAALTAFIAGKEVRAYFTGECTPSMNRVEYLEIR